MEGLLPPGSASLQTEVYRALAAVRGSGGGLAAYQQLTVLRATNEAAFFGLLEQRPAEMLPIVYTPTVGDACLRWGELILRPQVTPAARPGPCASHGLRGDHAHRAGAFSWGLGAVGREEQPHAPSALPDVP